MSAVSRRTKWHPTPPPPPSPKVLRFPRRRSRTRRRKSQTHSNPLLLMNQNDLSLKGNLQTLTFDHQLPSLERRERVEAEEEGEEECEGHNSGGGGGLAEEKWRFQAEILRAECNLLRMERELALKKLKKKKIKMERTLKSAVQTLLSGRKKIAEGKNGNAVLEEEIEDLVEKLDELQSNSRIKASENGGCTNFDKKASLLQRRLENHGGQSHENRVDDELQDPCFPSDCRIDNKSSHETVEQESKCSGRCKAMVLRIVEQVRAETEQWSQMQKMLEQVRGEMEELQASRDYWETRAHDSSCEIQSLRQDVEEWKEKALSYEKQVNKLELKLSLAKGKMQHKSKLDLRPVENNAVLNLPPVPLRAQLVKERIALQKNNNHAVGKLCRLEQDLLLEEMILKENRKRTPKNELQPLSLAKQLAKEKRSLIRSLKENGNRQELKEDGRSRRYSNIINGGVSSNRSPLRDIVNSSPLERQGHRSAFAYHSPESSRIRESFRK